MCDVAAGDANASDDWIGVVLSIIADSIIPLSLCLQKYTHNKNLAQETPTPYVKLPLWWVGNIFMLGGELMNLFAFGFAKASIVSPLGAIGIPLNAIFSTFLLKEKFRRRDLIGTITCLVGCVLIIVAVPGTDTDINIEIILHLFQQIPFIVYSSALIIGIIVMLALSRKYGKRYLIIYISLTSFVGSITVMIAKSVSSLLVGAIKGNLAGLTEPLFWVILVLMGCCGFLQVLFLNKAMQNFDNNKVVPTYYVAFTTLSVLGANILYQEFNACVEWWRVVLFLVGLFATFLAVYVMSSHKAETVSAHPTPRVKDDKSDPMPAIHSFPSSATSSQVQDDSEIDHSSKKVGKGAAAAPTMAAATAAVDTKPKDPMMDDVASPSAIDVPPDDTLGSSSPDSSSVDLLPHKSADDDKESSNCSSPSTSRVPESKPLTFPHSDSDCDDGPRLPLVDETKPTQITIPRELPALNRKRSSSISETPTIQSPEPLPSIPRSPPTTTST